MSTWWVYVIQSLKPRYGKGGKRLPGFYYVGATTDPVRRLRQHNGEIKGGGKYTSQHRPWVPRALYGPYKDRSEAQKAEYALKRGKRGINRTKWSKEDSEWCRGKGTADPWVKTADHDAIVAAAAPCQKATPQRRKRRWGRRRRKR
jgi:predicted GIY-YIG superfamily endonuclease